LDQSGNFVVFDIEKSKIIQNFNYLG
jgi:hypothetical protein